MELLTRKQIKERRKTESPIEGLLLRELQLLGIYPVCQFPVGAYRIDLALPEKMLAIECDGKEWHSTQEQKEKDIKRETYLKSQGWRVVRFSGSDLYKDALRIAQEVAGENMTKERRVWIMQERNRPPIDYEFDLPEDIEEREEQMRAEQEEYEHTDISGEFEGVKKIMEKRYQYGI